MLARDLADHAEIGEQPEIDAVIFRQDFRKPDLEGAEAVNLGAQRGLARRIDVAGSDAGDGEAAEAVAALEEALVDADVLAAVAGDVAGREREQTDPVVVEHRLVVAE